MNRQKPEASDLYLKRTFHGEIHVYTSELINTPCSGCEAIVGPHTLQVLNLRQVRISLSVNDNIAKATIGSNFVGFSMVI